MIRREDVAELHEGDVVEVSGYPTLNGATVRGPLRAGDGQKLSVGVYIVRHRDGTPPMQYEDDNDFSLTVVSRAPRPLYVNHPRTEPVPGDVVRDADDEDSNRVWVKNVAGFSNEWLAVPGHVYVPREQLPARLRLLVDGETGQVVP